MRRFECTAGGSSKFWEVACEGVTVTVRFGRIGTPGQLQTKSFASAALAGAEQDRLLKEKLKKGYTECVVAQAPAAPAPAGPTPVGEAPPPPPPKPKAQAAPPAATTDPGWIDAGHGYRLALRDGKLVCRNAAGKQLSSVPKEVKASDAADRLVTLQEWLEQHARECLATVELWMLRSLPVPRGVLAAVWADPAWRTLLENAVVAPVSGGAADPLRSGFLRDVDPVRGLGIVNLDGESVWLDEREVTVPHPILLDGLDDLRALATELSLTQGLQQLFREVFAKPADLDPDATVIDQFRGGEFKQLVHATGLCRRLGYRVTGGAAVCRVWEQGRVFEARFFIGSEDPQSPTWTEDLAWVDEREKGLKVAEVAPVAYSEGLRMAAAIHAGRVVEKEGA